MMFVWLGQAQSEAFSKPVVARCSGQFNPKTRMGVGGPDWQCLHCKVEQEGQSPMPAECKQVLQEEHNSRWSDKSSWN